MPPAALDPLRVVAAADGDAGSKAEVAEDPTCGRSYSGEARCLFINAWSPRRSEAGRRVARETVVGRRPAVCVFVEADARVAG